MDALHQYQIQIYKSRTDHRVPSEISKGAWRWGEKCRGVEPRASASLGTWKILRHARHRVRPNENSACPRADSRRIAFQVNREWEPGLHLINSRELDVAQNRRCDTGRQIFASLADRHIVDERVHPPALHVERRQPSFGRQIIR